MKKRNLLRAAAVGLIVTAVNFVLLFTGIRFILQNAIDLQHSCAFLVMSLIIGAVAFGLYLPRQKYSLCVFLASLVVGFGFMYVNFSADGTGWADLAGLLTYFMIVGIGIVCAAALLIILLLVQKLRPKNDTPADVDIKP